MAPGPAGDAEVNAEFSEKILGTTEVVWKDIFRKEYNRDYVPPKLDLFTDEIHTGCGDAPSSVGPFYCPADRTVYLDPTFFDVLEKDLHGSKAEFSNAYVIAHEVGHHVQNLLGYFERPAQGRNQNDYSVRLELQADYLAGVWAHHADEKYHFIQRGDVRRSDQDGQFNRRRPFAETGGGIRSSGEIHSRHFATAH